MQAGYTLGLCSCFPPLCYLILGVASPVPLVVVILVPLVALTFMPRLLLVVWTLGLRPFFASLFTSALGPFCCSHTELRSSWRRCFAYDNLPPFCPSTTRPRTLVPCSTFYAPVCQPVGSPTVYAFGCVGLPRGCAIAGLLGSFRYRLLIAPSEL